MVKADSPTVSARIPDRRASRFSSVAREVPAILKGQRAIPSVPTGFAWRFGSLGELCPVVGKGASGVVHRLPGVGCPGRGDIKAPPSGRVPAEDDPKEVKKSRQNLTRTQPGLDSTLVRCVYAKGFRGTAAGSFSFRTAPTLLILVFHSKVSPSRSCIKHGESHGYPA